MHDVAGVSADSVIVVRLVFGKLAHRYLGFVAALSVKNAVEHQRKRYSILIVMRYVIEVEAVFLLGGKGVIGNFGGLALEIKAVDL